MTNQIIIGIGGNINSEDGTHPIEICNKAICSLQEYSIKVKKQSKWYNSEAIPKSDQPNFFNCVVIASTKLNEYEVLKYLQNNNFTKIKEREENDNIRANPDLDNFIYQDENYNTYKAVYNNNPNSIEDITYYPYNEQYYEHPNERMAIEFENILNN